jgi:GDSL-like Lipase/Acylhydrolase family
MQAMNGSAGSVRSRGRLIGCLTALALALTALVFAPVAANAAEPVEQKTYLAGGDSISFGYSQQKFNENYPTEAPSFFEEGVVNQTLKLLQRKTELGKGVKPVNYACPGETSNGFIGENEALGGKPSTSNDKRETDYHPCSYHNQNGLPLHASLGSHSQLEELLAYLNEGKPAHPVKLITINIGSNDELASISECEEKVKGEYETTGKSNFDKGGGPSEAVTNCIGFTAQNKTFPHIIGNLGKILGAIDSQEPGGGHYTGAIVLIGFYNPDSFVLPGSDALQKGLNSAIETNLVPNFPNVTYANPFSKFNPAPEQGPKEKKAIETYTEMCNPNVQKPSTGKDPGCEGDIHPTLAGYKLLGKIVNEAYLANPAK